MSNKVSLTDLAERAGLLPVICGHCGAKNATEDALRLFVEELTKALVAGDEVHIYRLGFFRVHNLAAHDVHTPIVAGGVVHAEASRYARFTSAGVLKDALKRGVYERTPRAPPANKQDPASGRFTAKRK